MEANNVIYAFATRGSVLTELEVLSDALANDAVLIRSQLTDPVPAYSYSSKDGSELKIYRVARHWMIEVTSTEFRIQIPATPSELNRVGLALNFGVSAWANKFSPPSA